MSNPQTNDLTNLPTKSGIYQFFNRLGKILYIGKAKNLKSRVRSYFSKYADLTPAKQRMVSQIADIEYTITDNETEALLLETNLIKEHKPPYNVVLKDDKYWQYIKIDYEPHYAQIYAVRRPEFAKKESAEYFGPYTSSVKETLRLIKKIFPICLKAPKKPFKSRPEFIAGSVKKAPLTLNQVQGDKRYRGCFNYHLGRCLGPCVGAVTPETYAKVFEDVKKFIKGSQKNLNKQLTGQMRRYSQSQHYEAAARIRDQIKALEKLNQRQKVVSNKNENIDIISLYPSASKLGEGQAAINLFKVRQGKLLDKFNCLIRARGTNNQEIMESFVEQYYYFTTDLPGSIYTDIKLNLKKILNIPLKQTQRGPKLQMVKMGLTNAREYLCQQQISFDQLSPKLRLASRQAALQELKIQLGLTNIPQRIEFYDISNFQGQSAVGSLVVLANGQPKKSDYRKFKIKLKMTPDDPAMMKEILERRCKYLTSKKKSNFAKTPDLIVIDGGLTQLQAAVAALKNLRNQKIKVVALAKKEETIYLPGQQTLKLPKSSPALQLLQAGRDEAHRFAINYYRLRHQKALLDR